MSFFLQDQYNINTVSLMKNFICIRLRFKQKRFSGLRLYANV
jgi:hypothetical protein